MNRKCSATSSGSALSFPTFVNGTGFPIGPFKLGDFIDLDMALDVLLYVREQLGAAYYTPPRVLKELVHAGQLGQKTGEGFYDYPVGG
jgi:3-hydroxyacyl-CoA dehydrogenase